MKILLTKIKAKINKIIDGKPLPFVPLALMLLLIIVITLFTLEVEHAIFNIPRKTINFDQYDINNTEKIRSYVQQYGRYTNLLSVNISHVHKQSFVLCSIASDDLISLAYKDLLKHIKDDDLELEEPENFYNNIEASIWGTIIKDTGKLAKGIYTDADLEYVHKVQVSIVDTNDNETILLTVDQTGMVLYDSLLEEFKSIK